MIKEDLPIVSSQTNKVTDKNKNKKPLIGKDGQPIEILKN